MTACFSTHTSIICLNWCIIVLESSTSIRVVELLYLFKFKITNDTIRKVFTCYYRPRVYLYRKCTNIQNLSWRTAESRMTFRSMNLHAIVMLLPALWQLSINIYVRLSKRKIQIFKIRNLENMMCSIRWLRMSLDVYVHNYS